MTNVLPAGVSETALSRALDGFRDALGEDAELTSEEEIGEFRDLYWFSGWDDFEASAVVQPQSVEEIQAVLRVANERRIPLCVSSQGRNNGYGGSSPRVRGVGDQADRLGPADPRRRHQRHGHAAWTTRLVPS